jgi:small subunit ribosomal protein S16
LAVRLRLTRVGGKKDPVWRVVVADQRSPRDGRVIETIGHYNARTQPSTVVIDEDRARTWIERGAQPSKAVRKLLRIRESSGSPQGQASPGAEPAPAEAAAEEPERAPENDAQATDDAEGPPAASEREGGEIEGAQA